MMALGAKGVISVASNVIPKEVSQMVDFWLKGIMNLPENFISSCSLFLKDCL